MPVNKKRAEILLCHYQNHAATDKQLRCGENCIFVRSVIQIKSQQKFCLLKVATPVEEKLMQSAIGSKCDNKFTISCREERVTSDLTITAPGSFSNYIFTKYWYVSRKSKAL